MPVTFTPAEDDGRPRPTIPPLEHDLAYTRTDSPVFKERETCGLYAELVDNLEALGNRALGNLDYGEGFERYKPQHSNNIEFKDPDGFELRTLIVGEVAGHAHGTQLRASGNYYAGGVVRLFSFLVIRLSYLFVFSSSLWTIIASP